MRLFVLASFDMNSVRVDESGQLVGLRTAIEELRGALGELLTEHRPKVTVTFDEADVATLTALETAIEKGGR